MKQNDRPCRNFHTEHLKKRDGSDLTGVSYRNHSAEKPRSTNLKRWRQDRKTRIVDVFTTCICFRGFLIQAYYTPFFTKIQAFCKKTDRFVDYDKIYVNIVMLTYCFLERMFLSFSIIMTTSSVFKAASSLNIDFAIPPSFSFLKVNNTYLL